MITSNTRIGKMLDSYPETLNFLISLNPLFDKLNNKVLRKTIASRATVADAAGISNIPLTALLVQLNDLIKMKTNNIECTPDTRKVLTEPMPKPEFLSALSDEQIIELNVCKYIENGTDPFNVIRETILMLRQDQVLHLINSFEPVPLYKVLGNKGYEHYKEQDDNRLWHIYFYRNNSAGAAEPAAQPLNEDSLPKTVVEVDVRELAPPEPMMKILETLGSINDDSVLVVHHHREPVMLYDKLEERGFSAITNKINDNYYKIVITKKS